MSRRKTFVERLIDRLDRLDRREVGDYLIGQVREKGLLRNIFDSMLEGLIVISSRRRIALINQPAARLLQLDPGSIGQLADAVIRDPILRQIIREGLELPGQSLVRDFLVVHPQPRWVRLSRSTLRDEEGNFRGIMLLLSDITRQRKAENEVNLTERLDFLNQLTGAVAHELGNPLSSLTIHLQLLERQLGKMKKGAAREKLLKGTAIIQEEVSRLDEIVGQFLRVNRPVPLSLREEDLGVVIGEIYHLMQAGLVARGITLVLESPAEPVLGGMDKNLIKQVIINLIRNSAQAMPDGGEIRLRWGKQGSYLKLSVSDQGGGIPPEKLPRVFEPFFTTKAGGSGLGFLIVYKIVRQHGGTVEIKTRSGQGTTFTIWLPQRPEGMKLLPPYGTFQNQKGN